MNTKEIIDYLNTLSGPAWEKMVSAAYYIGVRDIVFGFVWLIIACMTIFCGIFCGIWFEKQDDSFKYRNDEIPLMVKFGGILILLFSFIGVICCFSNGSLAVLSPESAAVKMLIDVVK